MQYIESLCTTEPTAKSRVRRASDTGDIRNGPSWCIDWRCTPVRAPTSLACSCDVL